MESINEILTSTLNDSGIDVGKPLTNLSKKALPYDRCVRMILDIGAQIERLKESGYGILSVNRSQVKETTTGAFILDIQRDNYFKCTSYGMLDLTKPFKKNNNMAPEVHDIDTLPSETYYTAAFYSLGHLACDVLGIERDIELLKPTKLYFLLERCMNKDPTSRIFLFI